MDQPMLTNAVLFTATCGRRDLRFVLMRAVDRVQMREIERLTHPE